MEHTAGSCAYQHLSPLGQAPVFCHLKQGSSPRLGFGLVVWLAGRTGAAIGCTPSTVGSMDVQKGMPTEVCG